MNILLFKYKNKPLIYYLMKMVSLTEIENQLQTLINESYSERSQLKQKASVEINQFIKDNPKVVQAIKKMSEANCSDVTPLGNSGMTKPPASTLDNWRKL